MSKTLHCMGVIFHIGQDGVLFEFSDGSAEDLVGSVVPQIIKISKEETIPATADTPEKLSKYLQVGDELHCRVFKNTKLQKLSYTEDEEEIDKNGEIVQSTKTIEIQPEWEASVAALAGIADFEELAEPSKANIDTDNVGELEEQLDNIFDYDDVIFIEEVEIPDIEGGSKMGGESLEKQEPSKALDEGSKKVDPQSEPKSASLTQRKATRILYPPSSSPGVTNKNETFFDRAKLVQLRKPPKGISNGKVVAGVFEILSGQFVNKRVTVINSSMYVWGHHMGMANLMMSLRFGDECTIEHQISRHTKSHNMGSRDFVVPTVKNLWFGKQTSTPVQNNDPEFVSWLAERKIDEKEFSKWLKNQVPPKPYLPFVTNFYKCKVVGYVRQDNFSANGVILEIGQTVQHHRNNKDSKNEEKDFDKNLEEVQPENETSSKKFAFLDQEDFYICGVCVCNSDLRLLLKIDDVIQCQVQPISNADQQIFKKELAQHSDLKITHIGLLGYVGPQVPTQANLAPSYAACLDKFLKAKGISLAEFEAMRYPKTEQPFLGHSFPNQPVVPFLGPRGPFMNFRGPPPMIRPVEGHAMIPPPHGALPGVIGPFIPQVPIAQISIATNLAARAVNISVEDMRVRSLLHNPAEMEIAAKITQVFTKALMLKLQGSIQMRLDSNLPTIPKLESQYAEISQIVNKIEKFKQSPNSFTKSLSMPPATNAQNPSLNDRIQEPERSTVVTGFISGTKRPGPAFSCTVAKVSRVENKEFGSLGTASSAKYLPKQTLIDLTLPPPIIPLPPPTTALPAPDISVPPPMALPPPNISVPPPKLLEPIPLDSRISQTSVSSQQFPSIRQSNQQIDNHSLSPIKQTFDHHYPPNISRNQQMKDMVQHQGSGSSGNLGLQDNFNFGSNALPLPAGMKKNNSVAFEDSFSYNEMKARKERELQYQKELEQQKLWEDYQKEKKKKEEEEMERNKQMQEEMERQRISEEKQQKLRAIEDKLERMRQGKEQERIRRREEQERIRQREEQERIRQREEQERIRQREEQERVRHEEEERQRIREEFERKELIRIEQEEFKRAEELKRLEEEQLKKFRQLREEEERIRLKNQQEEEDWKMKEQERLWKIEMERRLRLQHQDDELERKQMELEEQRKREILMSRPPPPPKINKHMMQSSKIPPNPFHNFGMGDELQKRQQAETLESRMKVPPPPPRFSDNFGQSTATMKNSWPNKPQTSYLEAPRQQTSANQPSMISDRNQMWNPEN